MSEPIAIVGRGCVAPGALDPDTFWANIAAGRHCLAPMPDGHWTQPRERMVGHRAARAVSDMAGVVAGFGPCALDPVFDWTAHAARAALAESGHEGPQPRAGLVMGNLSYPSRGLSRYAEHVHLGGPAVDPRNRFCSGYPAVLAARELDLGLGGFALDAGCASALYAVKLGCDRLHEGTADLMLVGGVNAADMTFLQLGLSALGALSPTGRSRPFHRHADGLVTGEGAIFFALMRLSDAVDERIPIHGVIRGIGLSNDGRTGGFLSPDHAAQVTAMRSAYAQAGLDPREISLVECHGAGTQVGDATEIASTAEVFGANADVPVGSVKSNVGHMLTASGAAGLLKVLGALAAGVRPATLGAGEPRDEFAGTPLRPLQEDEPWPGRRRAGVSAFGFGGCNAHVIVESYEPGSIVVSVARPRPRHEVAVVAVQGEVGGTDLNDALLAGEADREARSVVRVDLAGLRFPPADLPQLLAQQSLLLQVARDAVADLVLPRERTVVVGGMGCDPEVARSHLRVLGYDEVAREATAAGTIGRMPNIVANRVNAQLDVTGPSYTVSMEEASGVVALQLAAGAIQAGEADAAVVGAVDLSHEAVHQAALRGVGIDRSPGDAAVVLVLKRLADARRDGDPVLALLHDPTDETEDDDAEPDLVVGDEPGSALDPVEWFGSAHAASGLLAVATAVLALHHRVVPRLGAAAEPSSTLRLAEVTVPVMHGSPSRLRVTAGDAIPVARRPPNPGPYADLPAHPTPVSDLLIDRRRPAPEPGPPVADLMPRPTGLAPVLANEAATKVDHRARPSAPFRSHPRHPFASELERVVDLHCAFLVRQTDVHRRYLEVHDRLGTVPPPAAGPRRARIGTPPPPDPAEGPSGPRFDRDQLLTHSRGVISELFGPQFAAQDGYLRQTRLPEPPMLLVDRVVALDAVPATMGTGTIRTQTDVGLDAWFLDPCGRMPAGLFVEAGQADLLLISWLGVDLANRGERVYRLLGCEITFHGSPPRPGDTLDYTIAVDSHHEHNGIRLFSFHFDCVVGGERRLTMRNGQAGFFTDAELADSGGVLWNPATEPTRDDGPVDPPPVPPTSDRFDASAVGAFADGRPAECFGNAWRVTGAHVRTPRIGSGRLRLLDEVTGFDPAGGPWGRGYMRASTAIGPDDWFFAGHFHNDPCMPGTLMLDGCLQAMSFYLAALGCTVDRDGWRFEPVPEQPYLLRCRGQVTPASKLLAYEVFVSGFSAGPRPTLYADVLGSVDGSKAFYAKRLGIHLVPDVPLAHWQALGPPAVQRTGELVPLASLGGLAGVPDDPRAFEVDGFRIDFRALLAFAWGWLPDGLGPAFAGWAEARRFARLPGPPYLFVSRVTQVDGAPGEPLVGASMTAEFDVPDEAWFFDAGGSATMPMAALVEVALQPCGLLSAFQGSTLGSDLDLYFRNLDGDVEVTGHVRPGTRTLCTRVELIRSSTFGGNIIQTFAIECRADGVELLAGTAAFGFFSPGALAGQVGLPPTDAEALAFGAPSDITMDLRDRPARFCGGPLRLPGPMLMMLDRVTGFWPEGGEAGLGRMRAERDIDPGDWYFKAHFYGDPVQPGSLGLDAMGQLLQLYCIETGVGAGVADPVFEPVMAGRRAVWKFRGQVLPTDTTITIEAEILEVGDDFVRAQAWLWVDGRRIYHAPELAVRIVTAAPGEDTTPAIVDQVLDPLEATWLDDHRPGWTVRALPMMSTVDLLAGAAGAVTGRDVTGLSDVQLRRWLPVTRPTRLRTVARRSADTVAVSLQAWREGGRLSRFEPIATGTVHVGPPPPPPPPFSPLTDARPEPNVYESGAMFHGPSFRYLTDLWMGSTGSTGILEVGAGSVPRGNLHQGLLDALTHVVPHNALWRWADEIGRDRVAFPHRISALTVFEPLPDDGTLRVEARFGGYDGDDRRLPAVDVQVWRDDRIVVALRLVEVLLPIGALARLTSLRLRAFLRDHAYVEELSLGGADGDATVLSADDLVAFDWLPGSFESTFGLPEGARIKDHLGRVAVATHVGRAAKVHPCRVVVSPDLSSAWVDDRPDDVHRVSVSEQGGRFRVASS